MAISLKNKNPLGRYLELGGGALPLLKPKCQGGNDTCIDVRACFDEQGQQTTDFTCDFNEPLPIQSDEFDGAITQYCLEHISWRKVKQFIQEMFRIIKPGGNVVAVTSNTRKQFEWVVDNPDGWDGKDFFESASCVIFGDNDYPENSHRAYFDKRTLTSLFTQAGFENVIILPYGERDTDLVVTGSKPTHSVAMVMEDPYKGKFVRYPIQPEKTATWVGENVSMPPVEDFAYKTVPVDSAVIHQEEARKVDEAKAASVQEMISFVGEDTPKPQQGVEKNSDLIMGKFTRDQAFDKHYFNGGGKVGGYANEGYRDFPVHVMTAKQVLLRRPASVLEIGSGRGYIGKRIEDAGIPYQGLEISKHCWMTRVCQNVKQHDICDDGWVVPIPPNGHSKWDMSFSCATLEHIPEKYVRSVLKNLGKYCVQHFHGIDFGEKDDGFDKTHHTLKDKNWWKTQFSDAGLTNYEIVNKEELEQLIGGFPQEVLDPKDGLVKLNIGSFTNCFHHGWINIDLVDLTQFAQHNGYKFQRLNVQEGLSYDTNSVDLIFTSHMLEHLSLQDGVRFLRECRRVIKQDSGVIRIIVPDADLLNNLYHKYPESLEAYDEINDECENSPTPLSKLWSLLHQGHSAAYDFNTMVWAMNQAGFNTKLMTLRVGHPQILKETTEMGFELSLFVEGTPIVG